MPRLALLIALLLLAYFAQQRIRRLPPAARRRAGELGLLGFPLILLGWLILTGRLSWLAALLVPALLLLRRAGRLLLMFAAVRRFAGYFTDRGGGGRASADVKDPTASQQPPPQGGARDPSQRIDEAYAVLGLQPGATRAQIIEAHKRLIGRLHPDVGGTDYLAAEINRARDLLLERTGRT